jgi:hypothetical protein
MLEEFRAAITWIDWLVTLFSFSAMLFAGMNWFANRIQRKPIRIYVEQAGERKLMPEEPPRKNLTRAEINGILGAVHCERHFSIAYLKTEAFFKELKEIQKGKKDELIIPIGPDDNFSIDTQPQRNAS